VWRERRSFRTAKTHLRHQRAIFAVMHSDVFAQRRANVRPYARGGAPMRRREFITLIRRRGAVAAWCVGSAACDAGGGIYERPVS